MMRRITDSIGLIGAGNSRIEIEKRGEDNFDLYIQYQPSTQPSVLSNINAVFLSQTDRGMYLICTQNNRFYNGSFEIRLQHNPLSSFGNQDRDETVPMEF
jgi:hypothetical protein